MSDTAARAAFEAIIRLLPRLTADQRRQLQVNLREMEDRAADASPPASGR
jgi:hypothetical protein